MKNTLSYFALPTSDFERAYQFYFEITGGMIKRNASVPFPMAYFLDENGKETGHLFQRENFEPSSSGAIVYMELASDLNETLEKVKKAGGTVLVNKTLIAPGKGYWALFLDSEGNRLALHSTN